MTIKFKKSVSSEEKKKTCQHVVLLIAIKVFCFVILKVLFAVYFPNEIILFKDKMFLFLIA